MTIFDYWPVVAIPPVLIVTGGMMFMAESVGGISIVLWVISSLLMVVLYHLISIMDYTDGNVYMPDIIDVYDDNTVISFEEIANKLRQLQQQQQDYSVCW